MRYFLIPDFGCKVEAKNIADVYKILGGKSQVIKNNGGIEPSIYEITLDDYLFDDGLDVI